MGASIPSQLLSSLPYIVTIVVLAIISTDRARMKLHSPFSLGETFDGTEGR
jgi:simple sugar transport system permease protein